jgi:ABC-type transport system substrate-binding protein
LLSAYDDYWGEAAKSETVVFRWSEEAAQRLVELQSGAADGIDNVGTEDFRRWRPTTTSSCSSGTP